MIFSCLSVSAPVSRNKCDSTAEDPEPHALVRWVFQSHPIRLRRQNSSELWMFPFLLVAHVNACPQFPPSPGRRVLHQAGSCGLTKRERSLCILMDTSWVRYHWATVGTLAAWKATFFFFFFCLVRCAKIYGSENEDFCLLARLRRIAECFFLGV